MSSTLSYISSTSFRFNGSTLPGYKEFFDILQKVMGDYAESIELEQDVPDGSGVESYFLTMEVSEVGDSFPSRVAELVQKMGPFVADGFKVTLVDDSMNEEPPQCFYGGPSAEAIKEFTDNDLVGQSLDLLNDDQRIQLVARLTAHAVTQQAKAHMDRPGEQTPAQAPPQEWAAIKSILDEYGLQAIDFVADFKKAALQQQMQEGQLFEKFLNAAKDAGITHWNDDLTDQLVKAMNEPKVLGQAEVSQSTMTSALHGEVISMPSAHGNSEYDKYLMLPIGADKQQLLKIVNGIIHEVNLEDHQNNGACVDGRSVEENIRRRIAEHGIVMLGRLDSTSCWDELDPEYNVNRSSRQRM